MKHLYHYYWCLLAYSDGTGKNSCRKSAATVTTVVGPQRM